MPRRNLHYREWKVVHSTKPRPKPFLSNTEETELSNCLSDVASRKQARDMTEAVLQDKGWLTTKKKLKDGWWMVRQEAASLISV